MVTTVAGGVRKVDLESMEGVASWNGYTNFMMFFDATVRGQEWNGNELESAASYLLFSLAMKWTQKHFRTL